MARNSVTLGAGQLARIAELLDIVEHFPDTPNARGALFVIRNLLDPGPSGKAARKTWAMPKSGRPRPRAIPLGPSPLATASKKVNKLASKLTTFLRG